MCKSTLWDAVDSMAEARWDEGVPAPQPYGPAWHDAMAGAWQMEIRGIGNQFVRIGRPLQTALEPGCQTATRSRPALRKSGR